ncbi:MAG: potassium transporter TrkA [Epsilonproteobacteria bacterium]|nr:potassium transporter TrkA [Campylobacterota bacterium]
MNKKISRLLIDFAYFLQSSDTYQKRRRFFYRLLEDDKFKYKKYFDFFMITLIFTSIFVLIREVKHHINDYLFLFNYYAISFAFLIEYLLRLWVHGSISKIIVQQDEYDTMLGRDFQLKKALLKIFKLKFSYMVTPKAIVDLLAILPFFHELRLLRLFVLFRVFKLFRYTRSFRTLLSVLSSKKFEFLTLAIFTFIIIFVSSVLIYVIEGNNPQSKLESFYEAVYWSIVTLSTVGFGDITPVSDEGRFVTMIIIISGVAVLSFSTSLIVSAFNEKLDEFKEIKIVEEVAKLKKMYLICGYESVAKEVCEKLKHKKKFVVIIDDDLNRVQEAKKDGYKALHLKPGSVESYTKELHLDFEKQVKVVLCLRNDDVENIYTALTIRSINKNVNIISLLMHDINRKKLEFAGVNEIIYPQELVGMITQEFLGQPVAFEAVHALRSEATPVSIEEIIITERIIENYLYIGDLDNKSFRVVLLGLYKQHEKMFLFNPIDDTILQVGDTLVVIGYIPFIKEFEKQLHKKKRKK